jgi:hypothetical protein
MDTWGRRSGRLPGPWNQGQGPRLEGFSALHRFQGKPSGVVLMDGYQGSWQPKFPATPSPRCIRAAFILKLSEEQARKALKNQDARMLGSKEQQ